MWDYPKWGIQEGLKEGFWELTYIGEKWTGWRSSLAKVPLKWHRTLLIDISVHTEVIFCWTKTKSGQEPIQCVFKSLERGLGETNSIQAFLHSVFSNQILGARSGSTEGETDSLFDFSPICVSKSNQIKTVVWVRLTLLQRFSSVCFQIKSRPRSGSLFDFSPLCVFKSNQIKSNQIKSNQDRGLGRPRVRLTRGRPTFPNWCFNWLAVELQQDDAFDNGGFDNALNYRIITIMGSFWNVIWPEKVLVLEGENHVPSHNVQGACLLFSWHLIILIIILLLIIMAWSW